MLAEMAEHGLERGEDGLEVYVMCEIPENVILAEEFAERFDGFSIGIERPDTARARRRSRFGELATLFDERNEAVKRTIAEAIGTAHEAGRKVGICGQAPSDYPEFASFLVEQGIDSHLAQPRQLHRHGSTRRRGGTALSIGIRVSGCEFRCGRPRMKRQAALLLAPWAGSVALPAEAQVYREGVWYVWGWGPMLLGALLMIVFWTAVITLVVLLVRWLVGTPREQHSSKPSAIEILEERFARGEIDREEFEERRRVLLSRADMRPAKK